ncbi:hypothetical protein PBI_MICHELLEMYBELL_58 [Mycobacterium phage MichelleMyBell]|uniref:Phage Gp37/Gp68 family protein n=1 Tax=Mycobacterium phage MichelleMyBell TaxID=1445726 RepID=W0LPY2_9CAUD|nr:hypothetical protein CH20_gp58 [Mycobacterium phage MichelleMyBell]AHG24379.1 hypothetical protein PBI_MICHELLEMYBELL_58 [Mycobacterium phage MichelleMyBell]
MSDNTGIEWCDSTWNVVVGCDKVSPGCDHCYAIRTAHRMQANPNPKVSEPYSGTEIGGEWTGRVNLVADRLDMPLRWRKPRKIFVNAQSDLFHDQVPDEYIAKVFAIMALAPQHTFQVLTKRHGRMRALLRSERFQLQVEAEQYRQRPDGRPTTRDWPLRNVWAGVSTENQKWADIRIPALLDTPAAVRFISAEPLLGPIDLLGDTGNPGPAIVRTGVQLHPDGPWGPAEYDHDDQIGIDWVIVGGESGPGARPMHPDWARTLRDQCTVAGVPFLFKQWGAFRPIDHGCIECATLYVERETGRTATDDDMWNVTGGHWWGVERVGKKRAGRELDGRTWDEYPEVSRG